MSILTLTASIALSTTAPAGQIHVFTSDANGFDTKTYFYDDGREVVAFDAQFTPALAEQALLFLKERTKSKLTHLVVTHPNPDKFNGLGVFKAAGAKVVASRATAAAMPGVHAYKKYYFVEMAKMFTNETYPELGTIDVTFEQDLDLVLKSGARIALRELQGPGVSSNQTVALIAGANALVVGDLVHHEAHAWLEGGIVDGKPTPTIASWIKDLEEVQTRFARSNPTVLGGRGNPAPLATAVPQQIEYLRKADDLVGAYVKGLSGAQPDFAKLQTTFEAAFPSYTLGYMVQYGAYGLVGTK